MEPFWFQKTGRVKRHLTVAIFCGFEFWEPKMVPKTGTKNGTKNGNQKRYQKREPKKEEPRDPKFWSLFKEN